MENSLEWFYLKASAPESQTYTTANDAYIRTEDKTLPVAADEPAAELDRLREKTAKLEQDVISLNATISALESKIAKVKAAVA